MKQPEIKIYTGKIQQWTSDISECKNRESICGHRLLAYGLLERHRKDLPGNIQRADELYACLEGMIEKGIHGKPYFREYPQIHFNISHSGEYGACALSSVPCGLDIQEIRKIRSRRLLEHVLSEEEMKIVQSHENMEREFCRFWTRKESFLKLSGEGITRSMKELESPEWFEEFFVDQHVLGCVSAYQSCKVTIQEVEYAVF